MERSVQLESKLVVGVPRERAVGERRVALIPDTVSELTARGFAVHVESGAGAGAHFDDEAYVIAGAVLETRPGAVHRQADILAKVQPPLGEEVQLMRRGSLVMSFLDPVRDADIIHAMDAHGVIGFSFVTMPRTTKAQSMDAMSSMSTVAGYKAVLLAANALGRFFPLLMTAAGTVAPARVVVIGAGVAGLQALATARRLGAVTAACDARPAVREQIQSVGASFIDMSVEAEGQGGYARALDDDLIRRERDAIRPHITGADVVISTAQVPGGRAPVLIDEEMVREMRPGSVIVDLAGETGGNCALTIWGQTVERYGVCIIAPANLPAMVPMHASQMYARNVANALRYLVKDGRLSLDPDDEIVRGACLTGIAAPTPAL
jgi:NAD(P) transhydrogenase subunit alpha